MSVEDIETIDDLTNELQTLQGQLKAAHKMIGKLEDRVDANEDEIEKMKNDVSVTRAAVPEQSKTKVENILAVVDHAYDKRNGGRAGVKLPSGEVTAVIDGSKQTALRLMDDIAGKFDWAQTENPGGPKPKSLKIRTDQDHQERRRGVAERYE